MKTKRLPLILLLIAVGLAFTYWVASAYRSPGKPRAKRIQMKNYVRQVTIELSSTNALVNAGKVLKR